MALRPLLRNRTFWIWIGVWVATRGLMVAAVGFWNHVSGVELEDVNSFESWSHILAVEHAMPGDQGWQYPPGAAFLMLLPRIGGAPFGQSFVATMLLFDLAGLALVALLARRTGRNTGVWIWLLALPVLTTRPLLRFDLVPTVLSLAALVVIHRRPGWFGALLGLGAAIKVWPIVLLFGEWDRRRLLRSIATAAAVIAAVFAAAFALFGDQSTFFDNQDFRGLQIEAVGATPWRVAEVVSGRPEPIAPRNGTNEIASGTADAIAESLKWIGLAVVLAGAIWWVLRERAIRRGRHDLADATVSRDFVFALVLALVVVSRVFSPQFMIWLVGLSAVVLTANDTRLARPAWVAIACTLLTATFAAAPANLVLRNAALLFAALDAAVAMIAVLWRPAATHAPVALHH
jgi:hypothetical protein